MKYLLVINTTETETVWNAFRLGSAALSRGHEVSVFLLGSAVDIESIGDERFDVQKLLLRFDELGGRRPELWHLPAHPADGRERSMSHVHHG